MHHRSTPPCRASAPPRSSTARAVSERPDPLSRSCPLRLVGSAHSDPAAASAAPGSRPRPSASARRPGSRAGATPLDARPRTRDSTRPRTRTDRRRRAPVRTPDIARIDRPRAAPARSGWTRADTCRTLPRGGASPRARREGPGGQDPGLHLLHAPRYPIPDAPPSIAADACLTPLALPTARPHAATGSQSPPGPPRSICIGSAARSHLLRRYDDDVKIIPGERRAESGERRAERGESSPSPSSPPVLTLTRLRDHPRGTSSKRRGPRRSLTDKLVPEHQLALLVGGEVRVRANPSNPQEVIYED